MPHIHFVNYQRDIKPLNAARNEYESGDWVIGDEIRQALLPGGRVYFHDAQADPSFFGGTITSFRQTVNEPNKPRRWVVLFTADAQGRGVLAGREGWKRESKFVP